MKKNHSQEGVAAEPPIPTNYLQNNKKSVKEMHFMKDRIKRYCEESGLPSKDEILDYQRLEFLKYVNRDLKNIKDLDQG